MSECTYELIQKNLPTACEYVLENCEYSYLNFYEWHYCYFDNNYFITIPILFIFMSICFYLLSDTSNKYLSPALTILSDKLNMSQNLAGVTFLALGNGAPDVIASIVASQDDEGGIEFGVGALIGAGVFVSCIVFSSVIIYAGEVKVNKKLFIRDVILYLISIFLLLLFSFNGQISLFESIGFFALYIINIFFAMWQDRREKKNEKNDKKTNDTTLKSINSSNTLNLIDPSNYEYNNDASDAVENSKNLKKSKNLKNEKNLENGENDIELNEEYESDDSYEIIARKITRQVIKSQHTKNTNINNGDFKFGAVSSSSNKNSYDKKDIENDNNNNKNDKKDNNQIFEKNKNENKNENEKEIINDNNENKEVEIAVDNSDETVVKLHRRLSTSSNMKNDHFYSSENSPSLTNDENNDNDNNKNNKLKRLRKQKSKIAVAINFELNSIKYRMKRNYFNSTRSWEEQGIFGKTFFVIIDLPFTFLRDITIPAVEIDKWNRIIFIFMPFFSTAFLLLILEAFPLVTYNIYITSACFIFLLLLSILICKFTYRNRLPKILSLLCIISFIMAIFWIWCVAEILIGVLDILGNLFNIPSAFLGMTLLSFGNSVPDLTLNCALAKAGYGEMGIAGSIAGPLFNLLIGLGASLIRKTLEKGTIPFQLFEFRDITILIAIGILTLNLIRLFVQSMLLRYKLTRSVSIVGYVLYVIFVIGIILFTFVIKENPFK